MAFQAPNSGQERANRKILEQLEEQKKKLRNSQAQNVTSTNSNTTTSPVASPTPNSLKTNKMINTESISMTPSQRTAIQHAHANSVGYFITQDSSFGNLILPVLPRFDVAK